MRALDDDPAVRDFYDRVDSLVLPALFDHPGAMEQLPAILAAAVEPDGGVLDSSCHALPLEPSQARGAFFSPRLRDGRAARNDCERVGLEQD